MNIHKIIKFVPLARFLKEKFADLDDRKVRLEVEFFTIRVPSLEAVPNFTIRDLSKRIRIWG
jgi:hypothetical protein